MCQITDLIEIRSINPPVVIRNASFNDYALLEDEYGALDMYYDDLSNAIWKERELKTNELLIDALIAGQRLDSGEKTIDVLREWFNKYGFIGTNNPLTALSVRTPQGTANCFIWIYKDFCKFLKAKYGYDVIKNSIIETHTPTECAQDFTLEINSKQMIMFDGCTIKIRQSPSSLLAALDTMLAQYITTDNTWQQFTCSICGKIGLRRNPKQCYCSGCSKKRYQVSRHKKRMEGR